jgi:hypothetical protein
MNGRTGLILVRVALVLLLVLLLGLYDPLITASGNGGFLLNLPVVFRPCPPGLFFYPPANACITVAP